MEKVCNRLVIFCKICYHGKRRQEREDKIHNGSDLGAFSKRDPYQTRKESFMTKIKIAAIVACLLATGAFAGFTYQAANNDPEEEQVRISASDDEIVTDEETTSDEVTSDEETTSEETTAEETAPVQTTAKKKEVKTEKKAEKKEAEPVVTTAPVAEPVPETITEVLEYYEAPAEEYYYDYYDYYEYYEEESYWEEEEYYEEEVEEADEDPEETEEEAPAEEEADAEEAAEEKSSGRVIEVTDEEYIWLCNVVGHEYGSNWISEYEKAKVVEVIMNRVNDPRFPNTIWGVLTQPYQFSGLEWTLRLGKFSNQVTDSVKAAVDLYLEHPEDFQHGYLGFWGDGRANHFYSI